MSGAVAAALAVALAQTASDRPERPDRVEPWRERLAAPTAAARVEAAAALRRALEESDLDAALGALERWPPTPALHLRAVLVDVPALRAGLLARCFEPRLAPAARALLVTAFRARADEQAPFRAELDTASEPRLPWTDHGTWVRRTGAPQAPLSWREVRGVFDAEGLWSQPLVDFPDGALTTIDAPRVAQAPAEGWLEIELARRGRVPLRRAVATWIVPAELAAAGDEARRGRRGGEMGRLLADEERLLERALVALEAQPPFERGRLGGDLLAELGLPCVVPAAPRDEFERGLVASNPPPRASSSGGGEIPPAPPAADDPRAALLAAIARVESDSQRASDARRELRALVDGLADRLAREPLLGGELAELLRRRGESQPPSSPVRILCEECARELWLLARSSRPGTRLVDLPPG